MLVRSETGGPELPNLERGIDASVTLAVVEALRIQAFTVDGRR